MSFHWKTEKPSDNDNDDYNDDVTSVAICEKLFLLSVCVCDCQQDMSAASSAC